MLHTQNIFKTTLIALFVLLLAIYGYFAMKDLVFGAKIEIRSPLDGQTTQDPINLVSGSVGHVSKITLNGRNILADEYGNFEERIALIPGLNILSIMTVDKFERTSEKKIRVTYKPKEQ